MAGKRHRSPSWWRALRRWWNGLPVENGWLALILLNGAVLLAGLESAWVQTTTTYRQFTLDLLGHQSFWLLLSLDILVPLIVALLSRRVFFFFLAGQSFLSAVLLHYTIFFYNPLTLSTIYHSMQGAASLGFDIFGFARWDIILAVGGLFVAKVVLVQLSRVPDWNMPRVWQMRGLTAVGCMAVTFLVSNAIYGKTGLTVLWVDSRGHRTATERRLEEGTREAVRNIGYIATWIGEWLSGTYKDTALIYAEASCADLDTIVGDSSGNCWNGLPLPPLGDTIILVQVESLDFAALGMRVNGHQVTPFLNLLAESSITLKAFAPHKVGSSNSDYELLNGRVAEQNVIYYSYIQDYPDSVIRQIARKGYHTSFFHGLEGSLFNLRYAYAAQGFEDLYFKEELLEQGYRPSKYIMGHIMDEDVFDMAVGHLDKSERQAQFIITMSSHIPFLKPMPIFASAGGTFARYVSSLRYMDQCLAAFYAQLPPQTVFILWGDHGSDVEYPRGFPQNGRHVPFLVHVKGNGRWLNPQETACAPAVQPECQGEIIGSALSGGLCVQNLALVKEVEAERPDMTHESLARVRNMEELAAQSATDASALLNSGRVYTLCELAHYLRRIFR